MRRGNKLWHRLRGAVDGYAIGIVRLIGESYSAETVQQAWVEFTVGAGKVFNGDDPHTELFFSWLFHKWAPSREKGNTVDDSSLYGVPPTRAYLNGEIMFAHLVPMGGTTMLDAISPLSFPPELKRRLLQLTRTTSPRQVYFVLARPELPKSIN